MHAKWIQSRYFQNLEKPFSVLSSLNPGFLVVPIILFFLVRQVADFDMWFHMAVGKQILATGSLPTTDQLSLLNHGKPVSTHLWLFQLLLASAYPFAGAAWLQAIQIGVIGATLLIVYRTTRVWAPQTTAWLLLLVVAIASSERFTLRPEIVSFVMIALYYFRLQQGKYRTPLDLFLFFILQEIWTNSHGIFVIGPFMTGCYLVEALLQGKTSGYAKARQLGLLTAITAAACIATPNGFENIRYAWRLFAESNPLVLNISNATYEMAPALGAVSRTLLPFWFYLLLIAAFAVSLLAVLLCHPRRLPLARTAISAALLAASLTGMKNMPVFAIVAAPLVAEYLALLDQPRLRRICTAAIAAAMLVATLTWSPRPALNYLKTWVPYRFGLGISPDYVPAGLPPFLERIDFSGPIFNSMDQGGFYEYHGYPERLPFYDSRLQDYNPPDVIGAYEAVVNAARNPAAWRLLAQRYAFQGVLLGNLPDDREAAGLLPVLAKDPSWKLVYLDYAASFWLKTGRATMLPSPDEAFVAGLADGISNFAQAENLDFFLEKTGQHPGLRLKLLEKAVGQWENTELLISLGQLQMQAGNHADAEKLFLRVLKYKPDSRLTLTTVAQLALFRGDLNAAETYIRTALRYYPRDAELRENLEVILNKKPQTDR